MKEIFVTALVVGLLSITMVAADWPFDPPEAIDRRGELIQVSEDAMNVSVRHLLHVLGYSCDHTFLWNDTHHNHSVVVDDIRTIGYEPLFDLWWNPHEQHLQFSCLYNRTPGQWKAIWRGHITLDTVEVVFPPYYYERPSTYFGTIDYMGRPMRIGQWLPKIPTHVAFADLP